MGAPQPIRYDAIKLIFLLIVKQALSTLKAGIVQELFYEIVLLEKVV